MNSIKQRLTTNWHIMRVFRTAIGIWMIVSAFQTHEWMFGAFGAFFLYQGVMDAGCCGSGGCYTAQDKSKMNPAEIKDVEYEEVK
jgi:hypothetical protein